MIPRVSLRSILDDPTLAGRLPADIEASARAALVKAAQDEMPWYLRLLMGGAAWVGALFMLGTVLGLVALVLGERVDLAALVLGLGLMPVGVRLRAATGREFLRQASLVCVIAGQLLVLGAVGSLSTPAAVALAAIASSAVLIAVFDEPAYRFGGTCAIVAALLVLAFDLHLPYAMGLVTAVTAVVPIAIWRVWPAVAGPLPLRLHRILDPDRLGVRDDGLRAARAAGGHRGRHRHGRLLARLRQAAAATTVAAHRRVRGAAGVAGAADRP